jgi:hypothetical protein
MALALIMSTILGEPRLLLVSHLVTFSGRIGLAGTHWRYVRRIECAEQVPLPQ